jgi:Mn2+/Fe2+ NRAMP family transporter
MSTQRPPSWFAIVGPGLIVAATGVGAGDLATGAFAGSKLGVAVLWAIVLGAIFKWTVNEGLARWQLVTGRTLLEGVAQHLGRYAIWFFLIYLFVWTFFVASALMNACGAAMHALLPLWSAQTDKIVYGIAHSLLAVILIHVGGFPWFERFMAGCVAVMFAVVVASALAIGPDWSAVASGLVWPRIPHADGEGLSWTLALIGGVGGTVTVLSYGYWIREAGRTGPDEIRTCRLDLAAGYTMTALFGIGMVIIGSTFLDLEGDPTQGTRFIIDLAKQLESRLGALGTAARWGFVVGAWCAVASSMLGVWQSVPFLFADAWRMRRGALGGPIGSAPVDTRSKAYWTYQLLLATLPAVTLWTGFAPLQKAYAITGAFFVPILAVVLLLLNSRRTLLQGRHNSWLLQAILMAAVVFFTVAGVSELWDLWIVKKE